MDLEMVHPSYFKKRLSAIFGDVCVQGHLSTSRGCPNRCAFCSSSHFWDCVRMFPVRFVIDEAVKLSRRGVTHTVISDDVFTIAKKRLQEISLGMRKIGLHERMAFECNGTSNQFDDERCLALRAMNARMVFFGFEHGSQRMLRLLKGEKFTVEQNKLAVRLCVKHGLDVFGSMIFGSPGETLDDIRQSIEFIQWCKRNGATRVMAGVMRPYPATPIWDIALKRGLVSNDMDWSLLDTTLHQEPMMLDPAIDPEEFARAYADALRSMHSFKWKRLWKFMKQNPVMTIKTAACAPWPLIRRMFVPSSI
jgi:radical SAM superfamily enzyme YgiQ (UPF0313 family)